MSDAQKLIQGMIEELLRVANRHKVVIAGFALSSDPLMIINFGNCTDSHDIKLYEKLCELAQEQRDAGHVQKTIVSEVN